MALTDAFRVLDYKLCNIAKPLQSWSPSVRLQLAVAKELVLQFDVALESRTLAAHELRLRRKAKANCLGLASMLRTILQQRSGITNIAEGDANTKYFCGAGTGSQRGRIGAFKIYLKSRLQFTV